MNLLQLLRDRPLSLVGCVFEKDERLLKSFVSLMGRSLATRMSSTSLDSELDVVYIASPNSLHFAQAKLALAWPRSMSSLKNLLTKSSGMEGAGQAL